MAKMPIKVYSYDQYGPLEIDPAEDRLAYLLDVRPNPLMTPTTFWTAVENNRNHYGTPMFMCGESSKSKNTGGP